jgi:formamidopyrimidine-DNA glycosylase
MPELPEIETIKRGINSIVGQTINNVVVRNINLRHKVPITFKRNLLNKSVITVSRRGKYLILQLNSGFVIIHLGMSGSIIITNSYKQLPLKKHDHIDINFDNVILRYNDPRRFGLWLYFTTLDNCKLLANLGVEPLSHDFNYTYLSSKINKRNCSIKQLIMTNEIVVGVGNIYACESLFLANISPLRSGNSLTIEETKKLIKTIKQVLKLAIKLGGSSLKDYKHTDGSLGNFQSAHQVYARSGKLCYVCQTPILDIRIAGRNSFYCQVCQH